MSTIAAVIGRVLIALIFILSGVQKLIDPVPAAQMLASVNLPASFALPTGAFELICGLLLAVGLLTRLVAILLAGFCLVTAFFFHNQFTDPSQGTQALKNLAMCGGLLAVFAYGQVRGTLDAVREERRRHKAEIAQAHADGEADGALRAGKPIKA
jgi:putative oxidoreductase